MAVIQSVSIATVFCHTPRVCNCIIAGVVDNNRCNPRKFSGLASFSSEAGRKQLEKIPESKRGFNGLGFEYKGLESFGMILGWRRIPSPAEFSGQGERGCSAGVGGGQISAVEEEETGLMEGDVVDYPLAAGGPSAGEEDHLDYGSRRGVGVIVDMLQDSEFHLCQIEPLCQEDPGSKEWIQDELQPEITIPIDQVRVLQAWYSQRMVPDRISNPHGEHAENLWTLE